MKIAVTNRAEETQNCFTPSKLFPADQFLRASKNWNYLKFKKQKTLNSCGLKVFLEELGC